MRAIIAIFAMLPLLAPYAAGQVAQPAATTFQALSTGEVFVLGTNGNLWFEEPPWGTVPPTRMQVDGNVQTFQGLSDTEALVLGTNGDLWLEQTPWGIPPTRVQVDGSVQSFQALSTSSVLVVGTDGKLWLESAPFGKTPPSRVQIDGSVRGFQALSTSSVYVLGTNGALWLEQAPFGTVPPARTQVDGSVQSFLALSTSEVYVLGTNGALRLEQAPFGTVPPARAQVDGNVQNFQALSDSEVYVLGTNGALWLEEAPFGTVPPARSQVDGSVQNFQAVSDTEVLALGANGNLWLEQAPWSTVPPSRMQVDGSVAAKPTAAGSGGGAPNITTVENGGSFDPGIAASTWVTIKGSNLASDTRNWGASDFNGNQLPTSLDGTSVMIDKKPAFVYYISPTQVNVLSPVDSSTGAVTVQLTYSGAASNSVTAQMAQFAPAFFTFDGKYIAATHADGSLLGPTSLYPDSTTPAAPGETIILYGTGFGPTSPAIVSGQIQSGTAATSNAVTIQIGGTSVTPAFAGLSATGEYQFNVQVPMSATNGDLAVVATVGGVSSPAATAYITVQN